MTDNGFRPGAPNTAYIGAGVTVRGAVVVPDALVVDGVVEGDVTARSIRIGVSGEIQGKVFSIDIDVFGTLGHDAEVKESLTIRSGARVEGQISCGDIEVEKGAVLAGAIFSVYPGTQTEPSKNQKTEGRPAHGASKLDAAE